MSKISARLPLYFEANHGQTDEQIKFVSRGKGYGLSLAPGEVVIELQKTPEKISAADRQAPTAGNTDWNNADGDARGRQLQATIRMKLLGATAQPKVVGIDELPGKSNYFVGGNPKKWRKNVPHYAKVRYEEVYPGIDLVFYGKESELEFDFVVAPGADPDLIRMTFEGADRIDLDNQGHLTVQTSAGPVRVKKPFIYQELDSVRQQVSGRYVLKPTPTTENARSSAVAVELASYDAGKPLVIDPGLEFSTFLGWSQFDDGNGIALDSEGNIYVVGTIGVSDPTYLDIDVFVAKFSSDFTLLYVARLGGRNRTRPSLAPSDYGWAIAVDAAGNAYITGRADSVDFPTTSGAFDTSPHDYADAFVAKLSSDGSSLLYSTRLGGNRADEAFAIAVDNEGNAYITGWTTSLDFPTNIGASGTTSSGAFVAKFSFDGSQLLYATLLGQAKGFAIAVDAAGNAHVTGTGQGALVTKLSPDGSRVLYATQFGGNGDHVGYGIALDSAGNAYVTGLTTSVDFPTTPGAFETIHSADAGSSDAFVVKLGADGSTLYSTLLGGGASDAARGVAVDTTANVYVIGTTCSPDFPTTVGALSDAQISRCGPVTGPNGDLFVAKLSADGSRLLSSTYLGGGAGDEGRSIALDAANNMYLTGRTNSYDFPTTPASFEPGGGAWDAFVAKLSVTDTDVNPGTIGFGAFDYTVREDGGGAVITVIRRNGTDGEMSVDFATSDSTSIPTTAGLDYIPTSGTLVFADGETHKTFTVPILDDGAHEADEILVLTLRNVRGGATLAAKNWVFLTIQDQDPIFYPTLTVLKSGNGSGTVASVGRRSGINCGSDCSESYPQGASVTLTASPASDAKFAGWSGGGCNGTGSCTLAVNADTSVTATFNVFKEITVSSPNGGQKWRRGKTPTIRWTYLGKPGTMVKVDLLKSGLLNRMIKSSASIGTNGNGSVTWTVPKRQTLGSDYQIRICSTGSPSVCDTSDGNFTIAQ